MRLRWIVGGFDNLQLDIVGLYAIRNPVLKTITQLTALPNSLAILGESSVLANAQVASLSLFFLLPRLIPAPQALIRTARPERLTPSTGRVVSTLSGNFSDHINPIATLLHDVKKLDAYSVRFARITREVRSGRKNSEKHSNGDEHKYNPSSQVTARTRSPLTFLSVLGCTMSVALFVLSLVKKDGMALLATILLSLLATLIGIGSRWSLELRKRSATRDVLDSDVVIAYPKGSFLIVKCSEDIQRELYFAPEECHYQVGATAYRVLSLVTTIMLMFGVIFLGNASLVLQISFAAAYLILNAAYWTVAALPPQWNWDLSCFNFELIELSRPEREPNFTAALWTAIAITRSTEWVINGRIAPVNSAWRRWLEEAGRIAASGNASKKDDKGRVILPTWDFQQKLTDLIKEEKDAQLKWRNYPTEVSGEEILSV
ncbi:hypothetical protein MMC31_007502 [Peltigera leucophlebia]|nr:hypothetical protein [Peltigera leucophlebia]